MSKKVTDSNNLDTIISLEEGEIKSWRAFYGAIRTHEMLQPSDYVDIAVSEMGGAEYLVKNLERVSELIIEIRESGWDSYVVHEQKVCGLALKSLLTENNEASEILNKIVKQEVGVLASHSSETELFSSLARILGDTNGRIFPYIYELAKSVTQSRRSRAGASFERIIDHILKAKKIPYDNQKKIGRSQFAKVGLGKKVDGIVPSIAAYSKDRMNCAILTMKTTLRERWQEVVEELERTRIQHMYLLTLDDQLTGSSLETIRQHNITVVVPKKIKEANVDSTNLISFETLLGERLPAILNNWE